jgi:hypothetical protein
MSSGVRITTSPSPNDVAPTGGVRVEHGGFAAGRPPDAGGGSSVSAPNYIYRGFPRGDYRQFPTPLVRAVPVG